MFPFEGFRLFVVVQFCVILNWEGTQSQDSRRSGGKNIIAYGGVLNKKLAVSSNNTDIIRAAHFGLKYAQKRLPDSTPLDEKGEIHQQFKITAPKKLKLIYTANGHEPLNMMIRSKDGKTSPQALIWGYTYYFSISWDISISPWQHNFVVTHYWDDNLYIFTHTFHKSDQSVRNSIDATDLPSLRFMDSPSLPVVLEEGSSSQYTEIRTCQTANPFLYFTRCHKDERFFLPHHIYSKQFNAIPEDKQSSESGVFKLKILSYNIWNMNSVSGGTKAYVDRIRKLAVACQSANADIIAFQEVRFQDGKGGTLGPNQVEQLADLLPEYQFIYQPAQIQTDGLPRRVEEGLAIFSKYPIINHDYLLLKRNAKDNADGHQRILLHAEIKLPTQESVHIFNTHLSLSHRARAVSVVEIWKQMQRFQGPVFLMGDFNAEAHNREVEFLAGEEEVDGLWTKGLVDSWKLKYGIKHLGYTYSTLEDELTKRIDLIFFRELPNVSMGDIRLLDDGGRREHASSDHLGLLGTYLIKNYSD